MSDEQWYNKLQSVGVDLDRFDPKTASIWIDVCETDVPVAHMTVTLEELVQLGRWAERMSRKSEET